jgi:hypothetical protein
MHGRDDVIAERTEGTTDARDTGETSTEDEGR